MKAKKIVTLLVAAALTCGVVGSTTSVYAADVTLKLAHADAEGTIFDQGAVAFQEKLQELSGGTMDVELYRNGTLGSLSEKENTLYIRRKSVRLLPFSSCC